MPLEKLLGSRVRKVPLSPNVFQPRYEPHFPGDALPRVPHRTRRLRDVWPPVATTPKVDLVIQLARVQLRLEIARPTLLAEVKRPKLVQETTTREQKRVARHHTRPLPATTSRTLQAHEVFDPPQCSGCPQLAEAQHEDTHLEQLGAPVGEPASGAQVFLLAPQYPVVKTHIQDELLAGLSQAAPVAAQEALSYAEAA